MKRTICSLPAMALALGTLACGMGSTGDPDSMQNITADPTPDPGMMMPADVTLDPASVTFFNVPINSFRMAVGGYAKDLAACITIVWDYSNTGRDHIKHCDDFGPSFPYVNITAATMGPCDQWKYAGDLEVSLATGCVDFANFPAPSSNAVDLTMDVKGLLYTGRIRVSSP